MRYGILGDIHANLEALVAVRDALAEERVDAYVCVGDIVGYGADPGPCVEIVRAIDPAIVAGNHDWAAAGRLPLQFFNQAAREAIEWTRQILPAEDLAWLGSLEPMLRLEGVTLAHGTLHTPEAFDYLLNPYDAYLTFQCLQTPVAFVGHSHIPVTFVDGDPLTYTTEDEIRLDGRRIVANVGSVGQPRDENPRAAYGVYDADRGILQIRRVEYDVEAAVQRIRDVGLPPILGERLRVGR